jgi:nitrogen regulatory protein P-II 1
MNMKKGEIVIRKSKFDEVKEALNAVKIEFFTFWDVRGVGKHGTVFLLHLSRPGC